MTAENLNPIIFSSYDFAFRKVSHQLLFLGYLTALPKIHCDLEEEDITGLIAEAIKEKIYDPFSEEFVRYEVKEEVPIAVEGRTGKRRRRLDLVIISVQNHPHLEYIFEAKRLRKGTHPIGLYVGKDGLECYIKGIYASHYAEAAMIGYIQNGTSSYWEKKLSKKLNSSSPNKLGVKRKLQKISVINSLPNEWVSEHERQNNNSIVICHVFLDCSATPT